MAITLSYSWTQGTGGTGPTPPATGHWYKDPNTALGTWKAWPFWTALDFDRSPTDGRLLALVAGPTDNGTRSRLRIYRFDDADTPTTTTDLETSDVSAASLRFRRDGTVEVFYVHGGAVKWRVSKDGGATFTAATALSLTTGGVPLTPYEVSPVSGPFGTPPLTWNDAAIQRPILRFAYTREGNCVLAVLYASGAATDGRAGLGQMTDAGAWSFGNFAGTLGGASLVPMDTGDFLVIPSGQRTTQRGDGSRITTDPSGGSIASVGSLGPASSQMPGGYDQRTGQAVHFSAFPMVTGMSATVSHQAAAWVRHSNGLGWTLATGASGTEATPSYQGWKVVVYDGSIFQFGIFCQAGRVRCRRDGVWEWLYLNDSQQPVIRQCRRLWTGGAGAWN